MHTMMRSDIYSILVFNAKINGVIGILKLGISRLKAGCLSAHHCPYEAGIFCRICFQVVLIRERLSEVLAWDAFCYFVLHFQLLDVCNSFEGSKSAIMDPDSSGAVFTGRNARECSCQSMTAQRSYKLLADRNFSKEESFEGAAVNNCVTGIGSCSSIGKDGSVNDDGTVGQPLCSCKQTDEGQISLLETICKPDFNLLAKTMEKDSVNVISCFGSKRSLQQVSTSLEEMPDKYSSLFSRTEEQGAIDASRCEIDVFPLDQKISSQSPETEAHNVVCVLSQLNSEPQSHQLQSEHKQGEHMSETQRPFKEMKVEEYQQLFHQDLKSAKRQHPVSMCLEIDGQFNHQPNDEVEQPGMCTSLFTGTTANAVNKPKKQKIEKLRVDLKSTNKISASGAEMFSLALHQIAAAKRGGDGKQSKEVFECNTTLRQWLNKSERIINRVECLHIFRQILKFVEVANSQGVVLRNIRPSCFLISSFNCISFLDSANTCTSSGSSEQSTGRAAVPASLASRSLRNCGLTDHPGLTCTSGDFLMEQEVEGHRNAGTTSDDKGTHQTVDGCENLDLSRHLLSPVSLSGCHNSGSDSSKYGTVLTTSSEDKLSSLQEDELKTAEQLLEAMHGRFPLKQILLMEQAWYTSPEELTGTTTILSSDIYRLGVLFFELFCRFSSEVEWSRAMSDLRHRVLLPRFLLECPKEAAFCLWLLHPIPDSRPTAREVLQNDIFSEVGGDLADRQAAMNIEEKVVESELTLEFLLNLQQQKQEAICLLSRQLKCATSDIEEVEKRQTLLRQTVERGERSKYMGLNNDYLARESYAHGHKQNVIGKQPYNQEQYVTDMGNNCEKGRRDAVSISKTAQLMSKYDQLKEAYFSVRQRFNQSSTDLVKDSVRHCFYGKRGLTAGTSRFGHGFDQRPVVQDMNPKDHLGCFLDGICKYTRYSRFEVKANLQHGDLLNTANMVCSLGFDRDNEFFAAAGVCKRIKVFECDTVLNESGDMHYPVAEMNTGSNLSSICWNGYIKSRIAASDYNGAVQVWDVNTIQRLLEFKEHKKRAWSVDFSRADPAILASGSDDCCVKLWSTNQNSSVGTIKMKFNVCCVQFPPDSSPRLVFGSADNMIYCYDLRNTRQSICTLTGHSKAVSFVRFIDSATLISASTDNTLKLWDITKTARTARANISCIQSFTGHTNKKNFVGLSVADGGYISCGSETNEVFAYHKLLPMPIMSHKFYCVDPISGQEIEDGGVHCVSSVCWRGKSQTLVAANSVGHIKLLEMV